MAYVVLPRLPTSSTGPGLRLQGSSHQDDLPCAAGVSRWYRHPGACGTGTVPVATSFTAATTRDTLKSALDNGPDALSDTMSNPHVKDVDMGAYVAAIEGTSTKRSTK